MVNKLNEKIHIYKFDFKKRELGTFDYKMLMRNKKIHIGENDRRIIERYDELSRSIGRYVQAHSDNSNYVHTIRKVRKELLSMGDPVRVVDVLVKHLFHDKKAKRKAIFWDALGEEVYANICNNLDWTQVPCERCGTRFIPRWNFDKLCPECQAANFGICTGCGAKFKILEEGQTMCPVCKWRQRDLYAVCVDCGTMFDINQRGRKTARCPSCQMQRTRMRQAQWKRQREVSRR